jgi:hypothetical protein
MCLNCGCRMWNDTMGDERNVILNDLANAAIASDMDGKETLENMKDAVESIKPEDLDKEIEKVKTQGESHDHEHDHK